MGGASERRTPRPKRAHPRPLGRRPSILPLTQRLTPRDLQILEFCYEHRVFSINQVCDMFFHSIKIARRRMLILTEEELVDRFKRGNVRNRPHHYILDQLGARIIAAHKGITFRELRWSREDAQALPWRADLQHQLDNNEFFVRLISACRQGGSHHLTQWWGERHCVRDWDEAVHPDGYARLEGPYGAIEFFFELDRGTESLSRLQAKLPRYEDIAQLDGCPQALLFSFPDPEREVAARKRLYNPGMTLATTVFDIANADPLGAVWLPIGSQRRARLLEIPRFPKPDKHA
jgi:protein involved in plasmid replication-relaxation